MPSIGQVCDTKSSFCPQPCIPTPCEGEDFGSNSNNQCLNVCKVNDGPAVTEGCPEAAECFAVERNCPPVVDLCPVTPECPEKQDCSPIIEFCPPKKLFCPPKKDQLKPVGGNRSPSPKADKLCPEIMKDCDKPESAQCGDISSPCDQPKRADSSCRRVAHCKRDKSPANNCAKNIQFPSVCEDLVCPDKHRQSWTQCPSILEEPPYACARNSGTQCPSQSQDSPRRSSLPFEKLANASKRRFKNVYPREHKRFDGVENESSLPRKARSRRSNVKNGFTKSASNQNQCAKSPCDQDQCNEAIRCATRCDAQKSKQCNNNNQNLARSKTPSAEEKSQLPGEMACNRNFTAFPSTSGCGGESLTDLVQKAVCSIKNLKASLRDLDESAADADCCDLIEM